MAHLLQRYRVLPDVVRLRRRCSTLLGVDHGVNEKPPDLVLLKDVHYLTGDCSDAAKQFKTANGTSK